MRRFLPKRLGSLALTCPKQPPIRHSPIPRRVRGAQTRHPWRRHSNERQIAGVIREEQLSRYTPSSLKHGKRIVGQKLESGDIPNRDLGCEMHPRAFQAHCTPFWK
jgi:hypothetical protein